MQEKIKNLQKAYKSFCIPNKFEPGDIVKWKEGQKNRRSPRYNDPVIVLDVLDKPIYGENKEPGSTYFNEPLNLVIGILDDDGDFLYYYVDSRRFEIYKD